MTANPRVGKEDDEVLSWLRTMSNDRFRRLPVVDNQGKLKQYLRKVICILHMARFIVSSYSNDKGLHN